MTVQAILHKETILRMDQVVKWYGGLTKDLALPIYSSYDIRDAGYKIASVDANIFPAGFNNICPTDKEGAPAILQKFVKDHYGDVQKILLVTEEHTQNPYYWENVATLKEICEQSGFAVKVGFPKPLAETVVVESLTGKRVEVISTTPEDLKKIGFTPDLVICNNDFSMNYEDWVAANPFPMNPPSGLGWYQRTKSGHFKHYNQLANSFSEILGTDPFCLTIETQAAEFDLESESNRQELAQKVDAMLHSLSVAYEKRGIQQKPFVFVKNNAGTYGLGVIKVSEGKEVLSWSYKSRKKMKAAKGGRDIESVIIQEGVPSVVLADGAAAEPVIYMIGCQLAGGFLRTHLEKDSTESLNSPGAVYKKLCVSDLLVKPEGCPMENVYGWAARLGLLSIALEAKDMQVSFPSYRTMVGNCG